MHGAPSDLIRVRGGGGTQLTLHFLLNAEKGAYHSHYHCCDCGCAWQNRDACAAGGDSADVDDCDCDAACRVDAAGVDYDGDGDAGENDGCHARDDAADVGCGRRHAVNECEGEGFGEEFAEGGDGGGRQAGGSRPAPPRGPAC
jgi:hypothetical protein